MHVFFVVPASQAIRRIFASAAAESAVAVRTYSRRLSWIWKSSVLLSQLTRLEFQTLMSSLKRSRETDLLIKVAAGEPLKADSLLIRSLCDSARGLPDTDVWDVSGLLLDGQPFSRETVSCWLNCAYSAIHGSDQLHPQDIQQLSTVTGLTQVLAFADAVGSYAAVCKAACSQVSKLKISVQLPKQKPLELPLIGTYWFAAKHLLQCSRDVVATIELEGPVSIHEQHSNVKQQVAAQAAALLRLAHVLHMQPLLHVLHQFLLLNTQTGGGYRLLSGAAGLVFTDAVLEAASGSSALSKEAYISSVMSQPCSLTHGEVGHSSLLKPVGPRTYDTDNDTLEFKAQLLRDFAGARAGDTVKVTLDLFGGEDSEGSVTIESMSSSIDVWMPLQLLLGHTFPDAAALEGFLRKDIPAE